jgi:hypothetical protein
MPGAKPGLVEMRVASQLLQHPERPAGGEDGEDFRVPRHIFSRRSRHRTLAHARGDEDLERTILRGSDVVEIDVNDLGCFLVIDERDRPHPTHHVVRNGIDQGDIAGHGALFLAAQLLSRITP